MLSLFRRFQKYIFSVVAVFIICSFSFFGSFSSILSGEKKVQNKVLGKLLDGKKLKESELARVTRFLASDQFDIELLGKGGFPNTFNDGVLRKDFFESDLAVKVANRYFDQVQEEVGSCLAKGQRFQPYTHPGFNFLSAEMIWNLWRPEITEHLSALKSQNLSASAIKTLGKLYIDQGHFPSRFLRQFLLAQEKQHEWIPHDPKLERGDLSLCHNHSLEDWVGPRFVNICAQLVMNGAALAEQRGYKVSYSEARAGMIRNALEFLQFELKRQDVSSEELTDFVRKNLSVLHMSEQEAVQVWQKVMLFRNLLGDVGNTAFLDPLFYEQFHEFADAEVEVVQYELPEEFQFNDFRSMLAFQTYIEAVGEKVSGSDLPKNYRPISAVRPELREETYGLTYSVVSEDEIALSIGTKELWDYKVANYSKLMERCPVKAQAVPESSEEKLQVLEKLGRSVRGKVDQYAAHLMIQEHPEWVEESLAKAQEVEKEISIPLKGKVAELSGILDSGAFLKALDSGKSSYCDDGKTYYKIAKALRVGDERILSFAEAKGRGILDQLVRAECEKSYLKMRDRDPKKFQNEEGKWKRLDEVFETVAMEHYASLLKGISNENLIPLQYAKERLAPFVKKMRAQVLAKKSIDLKGELELQWQLAKHETKVARKAIPDWMQADDFTKPGLSDVHNKSTLCFYQVLDRAKNQFSISAPMRDGRELIGFEAKAHLMEQLLDEAPIYFKGNDRDGT